jgi:D-xylose reductase
MSSTQQALRDYCASKNILFHGYSGLGAPDVFVFPPEVNGKPSGMAYIEIEDPTALKIAAAHNRTAAQVLLQWQYTLGLPTNVRSQNVEHMRENLEAYSFTLSAEELKTLSTMPQSPTARVRPVRPTAAPALAWD